MENQEQNQETFFLVGSWLRPEDFGHPLTPSDYTGMTFDETGMSGDVKGMPGDVTGMSGDVTGMSGDVHLQSWPVDLTTGYIT
jgi:hypothetical protein